MQRHAGTLRDYLRLLRRRRWIVLQAVILAPVIAILLSSRQAATYQAQAQVLLTSQSFAQLLSSNQNFDANQQIAEGVAANQAKLARIRPVLRGAVVAAHDVSLSPAQLLHSSSVTTGQASDQLTFSVTSDSPMRAVRLTNAYARSYTAYRHKLDTGALRRAGTDVGARIAELQKDPSGNAALIARLVETEQQLQTLETLETSNATVVETANRAFKVGPRTKRNGILGLALGVVIGFLLALLADALDTRVRSDEEVAELLGVPVLGRLPEPPRKLREKFALVMLEEPYGSHAEAIRMLRTNLGLADIDQDSKVIAVTSALPLEGKSTTIANLAVACARDGRRVVLVDLDLRNPMLATFFQAGDRWGVTDVALGRASLDEALLGINVADDLDESGDSAGEGRPRLDVLVAGGVPPDPGEFVSSLRLADILTELRARYDLVFVDSPPMLTVGDALALSSRLDAFVAVCSLSLARRGALHELRRSFSIARCVVLGAVVTSSEAPGPYGYGGAYREHRSSLVERTLPGSRVAKRRRSAR